MFLSFLKNKVYGCVKQLIKPWTCYASQNIEREVSTLDAAIIPLEEKEKGLRENIDNSEAMVDKAWAHANNLSNYAEGLEKYELMKYVYMIICYMTNRAILP